MINLNYIKSRKKWFKQYKKKILDENKNYYDYDLSKIYGFDTHMDLYCATIYDSVNNDELNKLVKKLYKIKKEKDYEVDVAYRKKVIKNLNYIKPEFDSTGHRILGTIKFLNDDIISKVEIAWGQINNDEGIVEFTCYFENTINSFRKIHNYIMKNYNNLYKIKYVDFYFDIKHFINDDSQNIQVESNYFRALIQDKISSLTYTHYSKKYLLPIKYTYFLDKKTRKVMNTIKKPFLESSYIYNTNQFLLISMCEEFQGTEYNELIFKKGSPINFMSLISRIRMPFYYQMFYQIEKQELQSKIINYLNSNKVLINFYNYKWLLNKRRRIEEKRFSKIDFEKEIRLKGFSNKKEKFLSLNLYNGIKEVYDDNIEYIKNINILNYNIWAFTISIFALIISIIAIFV